MKLGLVLLGLLLLDITYAAEGILYLNLDLRSTLSTCHYVVFFKSLENMYMKIKTLCCIKKNHYHVF